MLPQRHRLRTSGDYSAVMSRGARGVARVSTPRLVVHCSLVPPPIATPEPDVARVRRSRPPRAGFVVSKAVGNSVVRHRVTRRLRGVVADRIGALPLGTDLVVRALPAAADASSAAFARDIDHALRRSL